jgi:hypothetical protein
MGRRERNARNVLDDHLEKARNGDIDEDLIRNYAEDVVFLGNYGVHYGHEGARYLADLLMRQLPEATFSYDLIQADGEFGFLKWSAEAANGRQVEDGADSFVIRDGKIVAQSIYYTC